MWLSLIATGPCTASLVLVLAFFLVPVHIQVTYCIARELNELNNEMKLLPA